MFNFWKKKNTKKKQLFMQDLQKQPLQAGDMVEALRYDLGKCRIVEEDDVYYYESLKTGEKISWVKMIDARNDLQKVKKISS